jgi:hypothetical protein
VPGAYLGITTSLPLDFPPTYVVEPQSLLLRSTWHSPTSASILFPPLVPAIAGQWSQISHIVPLPTYPVVRRLLKALLSASLPAY